MADDISTYDGVRGRSDLATAEAMCECVLGAAKDRVCKIVLYGSRAEGGARPDSDFDLLVVESGAFERDEERALLREALGDLGIWADARLIGEDDYNATKDVVGYLAYRAHHHGITLYERTRAAGPARRTGVAG